MASSWDKEKPLTGKGEKCGPQCKSCFSTHPRREAKVRQNWGGEYRGKNSMDLYSVRKEPRSGYPDFGEGGY